MKTLLVQFLSMSVVAALILCPSSAKASDQDLQSYLETGNLAEAARQWKTAVQMNPNDHQAQFSLGIVQFLAAVEQLGQAQHRYGLLHHRTRTIPFLRLPIPENDSPEQIDYAGCRAIFECFADDLQAVEKTLAAVDTEDVKVPLHFGRIRLDLDGDGRAEDDETFWKIFALYNRAVNEEDALQFRVALDGGDVHWLRGYCHLLMSFCDMILAHDFEQLFERCGHLAYPRVASPHKFLAAENTSKVREFDFRLIADAVSALHLMNFAVVEPDRMADALDHLQAMVDQSRLSWKRILAETDDDDEWLPNPNQTGVIPNVRIRREVIDGWHEVLDELESILQGDKLIPFWRGYEDQFAEVLAGKTGVNLHRVFTEPRRFDLVLWVSGTGATPYLETGEVTSVQTWRRLTRIFGGEFFGFAVWFN